MMMQVFSIPLRSLFRIHGSKQPQISSSLHFAWTRLMGSESQVRATLTQLFGAMPWKQHSGKMIMSMPGKPVQARSIYSMMRSVL